MRKVAASLMLSGVGLFVYGILGFLARPGYYNFTSRIQAAIGAILITADGLLWKLKS